QNSIVKSAAPRRKLGESGIEIEASTPLKPNACPTIPGTKVSPPADVPPLPPTMSEVSPSAGHQLTRSEGEATHCPGIPTPVMAKPCATFTAGVSFASPAWCAVMVHVPTPVMCTLAPDTVQLPAAVNVTGCPDPPPVALTVKSGSPICLSASGSKLIAWPA